MNEQAVIQTGVILLGASNLTLSLATAVRVCTSRVRAPIHLFLADGMGRSYGQASRCLGRRLPGILECDVWNELDRWKSTSPSVPVIALISDIGNDIGYGVECDRIVDWISASIHRLRSIDANVSVVDLPVTSIKATPAWRFHLFRSMLFPSCRLTRHEVFDRVERLQDQLARLCEREVIPRVAVDRVWYGLDPVHVRRRFHREYWIRIARSWGLDSDSDAERYDEAVSPWLASYLWTRWPKERHVLGTPHRRSQPCGRLRDGSLISAY